MPSVEWAVLCDLPYLPDREPDRQSPPGVIPNQFTFAYS